MLFFDGFTTDCRHARLVSIKAQLAAGIVMAVACLTYVILYIAVATRVSRANRRQAPTAADAVMAPVYHQSLSWATNYQQQQPYTIPSRSYQPTPTAPVMMPAYQQVSTGNNNMNYLPPNQHPGIYPTIPNDRF